MEDEVAAQGHQHRMPRRPGRTTLIAGAAITIMLVLGVVYVLLQPSQNQPATTSMQPAGNTTSSLSTIPTTVSAGTHIRWLVSSDDLGYLGPYFKGGESNATLQAAFNNSGTYIIGGPNANFSAAQSIGNFQDTQSLQSSTPQYDGRIGDILDIENWSSSPNIPELGASPKQQVAPWVYYAIGSSWLAKSGMLLVATPGTDVVKANASLSCPSNELFGSCDNYKFYTAGYGLRIAAYTPPPDILELQSQGIESNVQNYRLYLQDEVAQIHAKYPNVIIYGGITDTASGVTARILMQDINNTDGIVSGYWLNVVNNGGSNDNISAEASFLQLLYASRPS